MCEQNHVNDDNGYAVHFCQLSNKHLVSSNLRMRRFETSIEKIIKFLPGRGRAGDSIVFELMQKHAVQQGLQLIILKNEAHKLTVTAAIQHTFTTRNEKAYTPMRQTSSS